MDDVSPTARALLALELIQASPGISGERLGLRLGVSDRAARRYVAILREADIPIESSRGRDGGYRVGRGFRVPPLMFSTAEAVGLVMAVLGGAHRSTDPADPVGSALSKIIRVLPAPLAQPAAALRQVGTRATADPTAIPSPETTATLVRAAAAGRRLRLGYARERGVERTMEVDPWGLALRHGRWYLLCWSHTVDERRVLRVDRISTVDVLPDTFVPPADLDPAQVVEEHMSEGWRYEIEVIIDASMAEVSTWMPRNLGRIEAVDADHTRLLATTDEPTWYARHLLTIDAAFHVIRPAELREAALVLGQRLRDAGDPVDAT
jgi:predicted DNA-binding transcriptional regulator YafY